MGPLASTYKNLVNRLRPIHAMHALTSAYAFIRVSVNCSGGIRRIIFVFSVGDLSTFKLAGIQIRHLCAKCESIVDIQRFTKAKTIRSYTQIV